MSQPEHIDSFYVLDYDRTLVDTDIQAGLIYEAVSRKVGVPALTLVAEQKDAEARHDEDPSIIIDMWPIILSHLPVGMSESELRQYIVQETKDDASKVYLPGARDLLEALKDANTPFAIITKGEQGWQTLKLECAGLTHVPHMVVSSYHKSRYINEWLQADGSFIVPKLLGDGREYVTNTVVLADDRSVGFAEAGIGIQGAFVTTGRDKDGETPEWIRRFGSLEEALPHLLSYQTNTKA